MQRSTYKHSLSFPPHCDSCDLLKAAPFTNCQSNIDPQPYVTACSTTLCKYPAMDGLNCQFLKAYVKACSLYSNDTLDGWSSTANCCKIVLKC